VTNPAQVLLTRDNAQVIARQIKSFLADRWFRIQESIRLGDDPRRFLLDDVTIDQAEEGEYLNLKTRGEVSFFSPIYDPTFPDEFTTVVSFTEQTITFTYYNAGQFLSQRQLVV
jgi:hypothetical protein